MAYQASNNLAAIQYGKGSRPSAIRWWTHALEHDPKSPSAHLNLALALESTGRLEAALDHASTAARLKPGNAAAEHLIGNLQQTMGDMERAAEHWRSAAAAKSGGSGGSGGGGAGAGAGSVCDRLHGLAGAGTLRWRDGRVSALETISTSPRMLTITNVLTPAGVDAVFALARGQMQSSWAASSTSSEDGTHRNSSSAWLQLGADPHLVALTNELAAHIGVTPQASQPRAPARTPHSPCPPPALSLGPAPALRPIPVLRVARSCARGRRSVATRLRRCWPFVYIIVLSLVAWLMVSLTVSLMVLLMVLVLVVQQALRDSAEALQVVK